MGLFSQVLLMLYLLYHNETTQGNICNVKTAGWRLVQRSSHLVLRQHGGASRRPRERVAAPAVQVGGHRGQHHAARQENELQDHEAIASLAN